MALDDFGTGYSSLAYLPKLPIDVLAIDKAFVQNLTKNPSQPEIIRLILALAQALRLETLTEGVKTREDAAELKKMGAISRRDSSIRRRSRQQRPGRCCTPLSVFP